MAMVIVAYKHNRHPIIQSPTRINLVFQKKFVTEFYHFEFHLVHQELSSPHASQLEGHKEGC